MGSEMCIRDRKKSQVITEEERLIIAYHETGHALVGWALPNADPIHKVTIIPRGRALGYTQALPDSEKYLSSKAELKDRLAMLMGGRVAEELIFADPTTGASNDIEKATDIARRMVMEFGMSEKLGPMLCLLYTSPSPRDLSTSRMPSSA